jgi:hypothetical protein
MAGGSVWWCERAAIGRARSDRGGKRAQRKFAGVGDRDSAAGDVPTLSSGPNGSAQANLDRRALCKFG